MEHFRSLKTDGRTSVSWDPPMYSLDIYVYSAWDNQVQNATVPSAYLRQSPFLITDSESVTTTRYRASGMKLLRNIFVIDYTRVTSRTKAFWILIARLYTVYHMQSISQRTPLKSLNIISEHVSEPTASV